MDLSFYIAPHRGQKALKNNFEMAMLPDICMNASERFNNNNGKVHYLNDLKTMEM